jgi:streptogrisin C
MHLPTRARVAATATLAAAMAVSVSLPASAARTPTSPSPSTSPSQSSSGMFAALQRDLGLTAAQAQTRLAQESKANSTLPRLRSQTGRAFAGAWFDSASGKLVVATTDAARGAAIRASGAVPRVVTRSATQLDQQKASLDRAQASAPGSVTGWYVDPMSNAVVVSVLHNNPAGISWARSHAAQTVSAAAAPHPLWNLIGGQAIRNSQARCSIAFNARSATARYILTAGHCGELGGTWSGSGGTIGTVAAYSFPGDDFAAIRISSSAAVQTALVDRYSAGADVTVAGSTVAAVNSSICRSGSTTGWHCGVVQASNQTVNYGGGDIVSGLTRTTVCAEPGDSGGAFVSPNGATRVQAQGITSGGSGDCSRGGTTFHQPVKEALSRYGLTLVTG